MKITTREFLLIEFNQLACFEALSDKLTAFLFRTIAIHDSVRIRQCTDLFDPSFNNVSLTGHLFSSGSIMGQYMLILKYLHM